MRGRRRLMRAPAAMRRQLEVLLVLTRADLRSRYGRGLAQFVKWLLDPFFLLGVYLALVTFVLDTPERARGLSLLCAIIPFQLVATTVANGLGAVAVRRSIVTNMAFPRSLIPLASALTEGVVFVASLVLIPLLMATYSVAPTVHVLWLPLLIFATVTVSMAFAFPAALFGLWFPDLRPFAQSLVRTLFFLAPGLVALEMIPGTAQDLVRLNPLTGLFEGFRDAFLYAQAPAAWEVLYPVGIALLMLAVFVPLYRREESQFAKVV